MFRGVDHEIQPLSPKHIIRYSSRTINYPPNTDKQTHTHTLCYADSLPHPSSLLM